MVSVMSYLLAAISLLAPSETAQEQKQARSLAREMVVQVLRSRPIAVRVYKDPAGNPASYDLIYVKARGTVIECDTVKAAIPGLKDGSVLAVVDTDQAYSDLREAIKGIVLAVPVGANQALDVFPIDPPCRLGVCTFLDAVGTPVADALIQVQLPADRDKSTYIIVQEVRTDRGGRVGGLPGEYGTTLEVYHPLYWRARVLLLGREPERLDTIRLPVLPRGYKGSEQLTGQVVDLSGRPIPGAAVSTELKAVSSPTEPAGYVASVITDQEGRFSIYRPLGPKVIECILHIEPPVSTGLAWHQMLVNPAATDLVLTLARSNAAPPAERAFHTFVFEDKDGRIADPDRLARMSLRVWDAGRSVTLGYDQFKDGLELAFGSTVSAVLFRTVEGHTEYAEFGPVTINRTSPTELVLKEKGPTRYIGRVIYSHTRRPAAGVYVLVNHQLSAKRPEELTEEDWQTIRYQAQQEGSRASELRDRVVVTGEDGSFEIYLPNNNGHWQHREFKAVLPGYRSEANPVGPVFGPYQDIDDRTNSAIVRLSIRLIPDRPLPQFVFEDESGPVTDPNLLSKVLIKVTGPDGKGITGFRYDPNRPIELVAGTYNATAVWNGRLYTFGPVQIGEEWPEQIVFRPTRIEAEKIRFIG
ncbi:MAG: carboxypeptidase-like regulatory domain-containing protein, partial [Sedimentisphaerales bacterium]|nr:carboxypeptidase-like regulatory domain-containing protein [Sedimentisphaerales bacterium]